MRITRTPFRISLAGGGSDMPSYTSKHPGAVFSLTIDKYVYISVNPKFDGKFRVAYSKTEIAETADNIEHSLVRETLRLANIKAGAEIVSVADIPGYGSGLGSSSAFTVGLLKIYYPQADPGILAERAFAIESGKCGYPVGRQDQYAASYGGMNFITFGRRSVNVKPIHPSIEWMEDFHNYSLLLWTGVTRSANDILKLQKKGFENGGNMEIGKFLADQAHVFMQEVCDSAKPRRLGEILNETWKWKKKLAPNISSQKIDDLYEKALQAGAYGGKLLGAGGGGFFFFFAPAYLHKDIAEATGLKKIHFKFEPKGSEVIYG